ncbi:MAG TPA: carboxypeptidase regulatory-like domain-containing protein [Candidatus Acidoferrales bacterium]|nr:carboxypeptidase regulatory-like domain-containing protein [Candidatus Acidoferrales bacterium]
MSLSTTTSKSVAEWYLNMFKLLAVTLGVLLLCVPAFSQGNAGRIMGTVTDQSGGVVAGATVSVVDVARGVTRTLTTDDAGEYNAPNLTPGQYTVRAEAKGFKKLERQNVALEVGKEVRVDLTVQPGEQEQTVTVTEAVPLVETTNATLGGTLDNSEIVDMPLNGRNYQNLLSLRPGVMTQVGGGPWTQSTNGVRPDESVWMIDGVINHNFFDARPIAGMPSPITDGATILPIDSIQEFNLMEAPKAEYGWDPGAVVNVGIRSGTNSLHGTAYGFYRSSNWDARNFYNPAPGPGGSCPLTSCDKPATQLKQFGGSVGGPIIKDKLFFFANYEGLRDLIGNVFGTSGVPQTGPSNGDASTNFAAALQSVVNGGGTASAVSEALAGCTVTGAAPSATATCTGGLYPSNPSTTNTGFVSTIPNINNSNNGVAKIDYHMNDKNTLNGLLVVGNYVGNGEDRGFINQIFSNGFIIKTWTASGTWDYTPTSNMVNEVRFGYNRMTFLTTSGDGDAGTKIAGLNTGLTTVPGLPTIEIGGFALYGTWHNRPQAIAPNPYWDVQESLSYLVGKHSLKFGGEFTHIEADSFIPDYGRGRVNFSNLSNFFAGVTSSGKALVGNPTRRMLNTYTGAFVQDDWRLAPKFTLNLGLRYEYASPIKEANNLWANFDPNSPLGLVQQGNPGENTMWQPNRGNFSPRVGFAYDLNGKGTTVVRGGFSVMYSSFTAVEWMNQNQFQNSSSVSLGANPTAAIFINGANVTNGTGTIAVAPFSYKGSQLCWDPAVSACAAGQNTVFPSSASITCSDSAPCNIMGVDPNLKTPYVMNYSLGVTHAFGNNMSLEVGYVGNRGQRLTGFTDVNSQAPSAAGDGLRPYASRFPFYQFINVMTNDTHSNYNSGQVTLTKRMSHGVSFVAGYTYAHGLDNGSLNRFGLIPQNQLNPGAEYGNSDFDVRHRLTLTGTYNIPGIKGFAQLLEGWQVNGILTLQSSQPWLVNDYGNNFSGTGDASDRWDFFGNPSDFKGTFNSIPFCTGFGTSAGPSCSFTDGQTGQSIAVSNSAAMAAQCTAKAPDASTLATGGCFVSGSSVMTPPVAGTFGTMGRNIFRDSGFRNLDLSIFKNFTWKERYSAQFRLEVFNITNKPIPENPYGASNGSSGGNNDPSTGALFGGALGTPDVIAGNPVVGSGDAREVQVGLKLTF